MNECVFNCTEKMDEFKKKVDSQDTVIVEIAVKKSDLEEACVNVEDLLIQVQDVIACCIEQRKVKDERKVTKGRDLPFNLRSVNIFFAETDGDEPLRHECNNIMTDVGMELDFPIYLPYWIGKAHDAGMSKDVGKNGSEILFKMKVKEYDLMFSLVNEEKRDVFPGTSLHFFSQPDLFDICHKVEVQNFATGEKKVVEKDGNLKAFAHNKFRLGWKTPIGPRLGMFKQMVNSKFPLNCKLIFHFTSGSKMDYLIKTDEFFGYIR